MCIHSDHKMAVLLIVNIVLVATSSSIDSTSHCYMTITKCLHVSAHFVIKTVN